MRRVLLFAAFLLLLGLTTATAASFDVQAEDITSFSTSTTIETPGELLSGTLYLRSDNLSIPGEITVSEPPPDNGVNQRPINPGSGSVAAEADPDRYHSWILAAPPGGYLLQGKVELILFQDGPNSPVMTAGLFRCGAGVLDGAEADCIPIAEGTGTQGTANGNDYEARTVDFGTVASTQIPHGTELRLKVVNRSSLDWKVRWGWNGSFPARLVVT